MQLKRMFLQVCCIAVFESIGCMLFQIAPIPTLLTAHNLTPTVYCSSGTEYMRVLAINVVGPFLVTKYFLPLLRKKQTRVVVNTSSVCGSISANFKGDFGGMLLPYNSSKAAINMRMLL